nr:hypothetical protein [Tanacetum cinerariifolium]
PRDNHVQQPPLKRQNVARVYTVGNNKNKGYAGILPLYDKCKLHHHRPCPVRCGNCKKVGHQARECWASTMMTCYGYGGKGNTKREFYDGIEDFTKQADSFAQSKGMSLSQITMCGTNMVSSQRINRELPNRAKVVNLARNMVIDATGSQFKDLVFEAPTPPEPLNPAAKRFFDLLSKADASLYKGCEGHSTLSATSRMLNIKLDFNMSQTAMTE